MDHKSACRHARLVFRRAYDAWDDAQGTPGTCHRAKYCMVVYEALRTLQRRYPGE